MDDQELRDVVKIGPFRTQAVNLIIWGAVLVVALWFVVGFMFPYWWYPPGSVSSTEQGNRGTLGDQFGLVNSLFSGLAFVGVLTALFMQRRAGEEADEKHHKEMEFQKRAASMQLVAGLIKDVHSDSWHAAEQLLLTWRREKGRAFVTVFRKEIDIHLPVARAVYTHRREYSVPLYVAAKLHEAEALTDQAFKAVVTERYAIILLSIVRPLDQELGQMENEYGFKLIEKLYPNASKEASESAS